MSVRNQIDLEAFRWVVLIEEGPLSAEQQREFEAWRARSPNHEGAYIRAQAINIRYDRLAALAGGRGVVDPPAHPDMARRRALAATAAAMGLMGVGAWLGKRWIGDAEYAERYVSNVGQLRKIALADGSALLLNTVSEVFVRSRREIRFVRGETLLSIAFNTRPFIVRVGEWIILATQAAFAVRQSAAIGIMVTEGSAHVLSTDSRIKPMPLFANQETTLRAGSVPEVLHVSDAEIGRRLAWRAGMVIFDGQPLHEVLVEMNRYSKRPIVCDDPALSERHIIGVFRVTDIERFISMLQTQYSVQAISDGTTVRLRPRQN